MLVNEVVNSQSIALSATNDATYIDGQKLG